MDESSGFVEFYITCNPPLLPKGVQYVVETAKSALPEGEIIEILYEPEIPWLKCITTAKSRHEATELIQSLLLIMLEEETDAVDVRVANQDESDDDTAPPDVVIVTEDPRVIPWPTYQDLGSDLYIAFEAYRFPETMLCLAFKAVWRGLEHGHGGTIENLLAGFRFVSKDENAPATVNEFEELMKCQISYNMRENLIYIGTDESMEAVQRAVKKLGTMFSFMTTKPCSTAHFILTEGSGPLKIAYKWLSHIGLVRTTYVQPDNSSLTDEHRLLMGAATLRTEVQDRHERWIFDKTVYPLQDGPDTDFSKTFSPFNRCIFRSKAASPGFKTQPLDAPRGVSKPQQGPAPSTALRGVSHQVSHNPAKGGLNQVSLAAEGKTAVAPVPAHVHVHDRKDSSSHKSEAVVNSNLSLRKQEIEQKVLSLNAQPTATVLQTAPLEAMPTPQSVISNWRNSVKDATKDVTTKEDPKTENLSELLISFGQSDDEGLGADGNVNRIAPNITSCMEPLRKQNMSPFEQSDDLIWLGDEPQSERGPCFQGTALALDQRRDACAPNFSNSGGGRGLINTFGLEELSALTVNDNPLESQDHVSNTGEDPDFVAQFGLLDHKPKELFRTMNQQGSRDRSRRANNLPSPGNQGSPASKSEGAALVNQMASQDGRVSEKGVTSTPSGTPANWGKTKPSPNTALDSEWPKVGRMPTSPIKQAKKPLSYSDATKLNNPNVLGRAQQAPPRFPDFRSNANRELPESEFERHALASKGAVSPHGGRNDSQVKLPVAEKPRNEYTESLMVKSEVLLSTELELKNKTKILQMTPGYVSLEVKFGRIYIKQIAHNLVNSGSGPSFTVDEAFEFLNNPKFQQSRIGFSSILTTMGEDADRLARINPPGEARWRPFEKETWYDFVCSFCNNQDRRFVVEVDAETFRYRCRGLRQEVFTVYLHCPHRAWDMKACATRSSPLHTDPKYRAFAETLIALTAVCTDGAEAVTIETPEEGELEASIECINIRQVARYRQAKQGSELAITMTWAMQESTSAKRAPKGKKSRVWSRPSASPEGGIPHQWFEASISSSSTKELFDQNTDLEYGEKASWDADQLGGAFEDMCRPAFGMITHMDHIGSMNNNGQGLGAHDAFHDAMIESDVRKRKWVFW